VTSPKINIQPTARTDVDSYVLWLRAEADSDVARRFAVASITTFDTLGASPFIGSPVDLKIEPLTDLRKWKVKGFPKMLVFYRPIADGVSIIRVLHTAQDWWSLLDSE
jgi:toxin ParE1/3/4